MAQANVAHVVVVCESASSLQNIRGRLYNWYYSATSRGLVTTVVLSDANEEDAIKLIEKRLTKFGADSIVDSKTILKAIKCIGGRLSDIEALLEKVKAGVSLEKALEELIMKAIVEIRRTGLREAVEADNPNNQTG